ncbi:CG3163 [Drosophila busckii]|uniref:CG3163 n=2 Tax=Drosophila busckii TaxID=30019 RepID=A0A0M4E7H5_DROBS|nr:CG3163 [Drosophila busckii]
MYNVERTKQKINNLRCAFRHQLRKYNEVKKNGEKYEPYCPKRRYFESLMFLKDEEIGGTGAGTERRVKRADNLRVQQNTETNNTVVLVQHEPCEEFSDVESLPKQAKTDLSKLSPSNSTNEFCTNLFEEVEADPIISIETVNSSTHVEPQSSTTIKEIEVIMPAERSKSIQSLSSISTPMKDRINSTVQIVDSNRDKRISARQKYINKNTNNTINNTNSNSNNSIANRKRSLSISSQTSQDDNEMPPAKCRAEISSSDFERLFSLALKNANNSHEDPFSSFGKVIAHKLRTMDSTQAIYAEKVIADVLYQGQMKMLSALSITQFLGVDNTTVYVESPSK